MKHSKKEKKEELVKKNDNSIEDIEQIEDLIIKKNTKIKMFFILFLVIFVISGLSMISTKNHSKYSNMVEKIDISQFIIVKDDGKYGFINDSGKVVIKPSYDEVENYIGDYAKVKDGNKYKLIDKKGKVKFESSEKNGITYVNEYNIWIINNDLYSSNLNKLNKKNTKVKYQNYGYLKWINSNDKKAGIMDYRGKITYEYKIRDEKSNFSIISISTQNDLEESNKYCVVNSDNKKYAIVNCKTGKEIYKYTDNYIFNENGTYYEIRKPKDNSFVERVIIINDEIVYESKNKDEKIYNFNNYFTITNTSDRKYLYLSKKDGKITEEQPNVEEIDVEEVTSEKIMDVKVHKCSRGYEVKSDKGRKLSCEWDDIKLFDSKVTNYLISKNKYYVLAHKDEKYYIINLSNNKKIASFESSSVTLTEGSLFIEYIDDKANKKIVYSLISNKSKEFELDENISLYTNYFTVLNSDKLNYYNVKLKSIYTSIR